MPADNSDSAAVDYDTTPYSQLRAVLAGRGQRGDVVRYTPRSSLIRLEIEPNIWEIVVDEQAVEAINATHFMSATQLANYVSDWEGRLPENWEAADVIEGDPDDERLQSPDGGSG